MKWKSVELIFIRAYSPFVLPLLFCSLFLVVVFFSSSYKKACRLMTLYFLPVFLITLRIGKLHTKTLDLPKWLSNWKETPRGTIYTSDNCMVLQSRQAGNINNQHAQWVNKYMLFDEYVMSSILTKWPLSNCNSLYRLKCSKLMRHLFSGNNY